MSDMGALGTRPLHSVRALSSNSPSMSVILRVTSLFMLMSHIVYVCWAMLQSSEHPDVVSPVHLKSWGFPSVPRCRGEVGGG